MVKVIIEKWTNHANDLIQTAHFLHESANISLSEKGASDPKIVSLALLCRTLSNFKGGLLLIQNGRLVEGRMLVRACYENLIYVSAIGEEGYNFVKKMALADLAHHKSRGESLMAAAKNTEPEEEWRTPLREYLKKIKEKQLPSSTTLSPKEISKNGPVAKAYIMYEQLSADSAHPTTDALKRYISKIVENGETIGCIDIEPIVDNNQTIQTLDWACSAMLGVLVGVNQNLGGTAANQKVIQVFADRENLAKQVRR